jgi:flagellar hook-length control protein FliK
MSALDRSQALNALNLKPSLPATAAAPARNQDKGPEGQEETSKARFSRLLANSRAEASQKPADTPDRTAKTPASPTRSARAAARNSDDHADKAADEVEAPPSSTPSRSGVAVRGATARDAQDTASSDDKATDAESTANAAAPEAAPPSASGNASDLAAWLASLPPAPTAVPMAPPTAGDAGAAPGDAADGTDPTTNLLGMAGPGVPGLETALTAVAGAKGSDAGAANALTSTTERWLGQTAPTPALADSKAIPDTNTGAAALPSALLASLAAGTLGAGKSEDAPRTSVALDALPLASSAAIAGHGVASLARAIDTPAAASAAVPTPVGDPGFHEALAAQVSVFARAGLSKAELHLNPAELGPVSVHIMMNGDQARVDFGADRAQTRQAIEAGWAELAASLQDAGFTLSGGGVSEQAQRQAAERQATPQGPRADRTLVVDDVPAASIVAARPRAGSALDLYA